MNERNTTGSKSINVLGDEELTKVVGGYHGPRHRGGGMGNQGGGGMRRGGGGGGGQGRAPKVIFLFINNGVINNGTIGGNVANQ